MRHDNKRDIRSKEVRLLEKEHFTLISAKYDLGYIDLPKPLRHGWTLHLILREDISRRKDAKIFEEILNVCGITIWGSDKKHAEKKWIYEHRYSRVIVQRGIKPIDKQSFLQLSRKAQRWFRKQRLPWRIDRTDVYAYYPMVPQYFFTLTYTRAYIIRRRIIDAEIESRIQEIEEVLLSDKYYKYTFFGGRGKYKWIKHSHKSIRRRVHVRLQQMCAADKDELPILISPSDGEKWSLYYC